MANSTVTTCNEYLKKMAADRIAATMGTAQERVEPLDVAAAIADAASAASSLDDAISSGKPWTDVHNIIKDHEVTRSIVNTESMRVASLDRRRKIIAGLNHAGAIKVDGGIIDIAVRSRT